MHHPRTIRWAVGAASFVAALALLGPHSAGAQSADEVPTAPVLGLETGTHTAQIWRIDVDAANRYLVTGSADKTVRVWSLGDGGLVRTLRIPIDSGDLGKVYAVALAPDGGTVAVGGWTGYPAWGGHSVFLFDRASGELQRRIPGLPDVILHLAYSRDGRHLAATLGGSNGIRVYETGDYGLVAEDEDYSSPSYWADFDRSGRLVTTSDDGHLRLYDREFRLSRKREAPGGKHPFSAAFSPDGRRIAVGFDDTQRVDVLSGDDLAFEFSPDTDGLDNGNLFTVAWSVDGRFLYAGGMYDVGGWNLIRRWRDAGRGRYVEYRVATNTIMDLEPLRDGGLAFGAQDPVIGVLDRDGDELWTRRPEIADFRDQEDVLAVSADGGTVRFGYEPRGGRPARFAIAERRLESDPPADASVSNAITEASGLKITGWRNTRSPELNGAPLSLKDFEMSRSLAIAPDGARFLLGTEWRLRLFDREGSQQWTVPVQAAWAVNVTGDGRLAVAALGDGTIRWYRLRDGAELLALFAHKDGKRWVVWTPQGYYDASAGADDLIGWHLNQGYDRAPAFYPISRFRERFYRPDVIAKVLDTLDVQEALRLADQVAGRPTVETDIRSELPALVRILEPADGATVSEQDLIVTYLVRSPSGDPVTGIRALIDGRPATNMAGLSLASEEGAIGKIIVRVPAGDSAISLIVENKHGASEAATIKVRWRDRADAEDRVKPKLYVLAVGVAAYKNLDRGAQLKFAAKDAREFAEMIKRQKGGIYRDVQIRLLPDDEADRESVLDGLDWLQKQTTQRDVAILYLSGHGVTDAKGRFHFLPYDVDLSRLKRTSVRHFDIEETLESIAGKVLFFFDTCYSGSLLKGKGPDSRVDVAQVANELASAENGVVVFASSTGRQFSLERDEWQNGAFTEALLEALAGAADNTQDGKITVSELEQYLSERVKALTGGDQTPTSAKPKAVQDFPIAVVM